MCVGMVFERGSFAGDNNTECGYVALVERTYFSTDSFNYWRNLGLITQQYANSRSRLRMSTGDTLTNDRVKVLGTLSLLYIVD